MANGKRKATTAPAEEPTPKRGKYWRPRTRHEKTVEFSQPALGTAELFENILLCLPMKDLFVVQRVCTVWWDAIHNSPSLRKKMFLKPCRWPLHPELEIRGDPTSKHNYNSAIHVNPAIAIGAVHPGEAEVRATNIPKKQFGKAEVIQMPNEPRHALVLRTRHTQTRGSWIKMLVCQPPPISIVMVGTPEPANGVPLDIIPVSNHSGLTWGDLHNAVAGFMKISPGRKLLPASLMFLDDASQTAEIQEGWKYCKGHKDWDGKCGCVWLLHE